MTRLTVAAAAAALVALVAAAAVAFGDDVRPGGARSDGPMQPTGEHGIVAEGRQGTVFTDGFEVLRLRGDHEATIVKVESIGGEGTFRQLGALIAGDGRQDGAISYLEGFPPTDASLGDLADAEGAVIKPRTQTRHETGYELLVGYEILDDTQVGYRTALEVTYAVGGTEYLWRSPGRILYCPEPMRSEACHKVAEDDNWGE